MATREKTLSLLAATTDALDNLDAVIKQLRAATAESRCLEWKLTSPFDRNVTIRAKYRCVKAAISFANADGGFLLMGVDPKGTWVGLSDEELAHLDPAKITELINGAVFPDLPVINFAQFPLGRNNFAVIQVPPSPLLPHTTTREITEVDAAGVRKIVLARHTIYYRHGGKSDAATPAQVQRMVEKRMLHVRDELVRRVKEVAIPVITPRSAGGLST